MTPLHWMGFTLLCLTKGCFGLLRLSGDVKSLSSETPTSLLSCSNLSTLQLGICQCPWENRARFKTLLSKHQLPVGFKSVLAFGAWYSRLSPDRCHRYKRDLLSNRANRTALHLRNWALKICWTLDWSRTPRVRESSCSQYRGFFIKDLLSVLQHFPWLWRGGDHQSESRSKIRITENKWHFQASLQLECTEGK